MKQEKFNRDLIEFIGDSPTPFHAVENMRKALLKAGFTELLEKDHWDLNPRGKYFVTREESSIIAFTTGSNDLESSGFRMFGAHTDSPCLKIKPTPEYSFHNYLNLMVDVYGGVLLMTWFDRDLSIAGRVSGTDENGNLQSLLIDFERPVAVLPNLAIHLNREVNNSHTINRQDHTAPLFLQFHEKDRSRTDFFHELLKKEINSKYKESQFDKVYHFDLSLYDTQKPAIVGYREDYLTSARLDNLLSCFCGLQAICEHQPDNPALLICTDHEEVGSSSHSGAAGPFLKDVLKRVATDPQAYARLVNQSFLMSADNAHGVHPNYKKKHDNQHLPFLNQGPALKINVNQRYASNDVTLSYAEAIGKKANVPLQRFVNRSDLGCGSTIGPITASNVGVRTVDLGVPTFGMHSIRETAGSKDAHMLYLLAKELFRSEGI